MKTLFIGFVIFCLIGIRGLAQNVATELPNTVKDYDGNTYKTIQIGEQIWMGENLRTQHYTNGSKIRGCFAYNDSDSLLVKYGCLYTWKWAMNSDTREMTQGVCPSGWHLPSEKEWDELISVLGNKPYAGVMLKVADTTYWNEQIKPDSANISKLAFRGAGYFDGEYEYFYDLKKATYFWTSTSKADKFAMAVSVKANADEAEHSALLKIYGFSVRCVKDK